jgi:hypothetical protein
MSRNGLDEDLGLVGEETSGDSEDDLAGDHARVV